MKQLEIKNKKLIDNILSFYTEIGIEMYIPNSKSNNHIAFLTNNNDKIRKVNFTIEDREKQLNELEHLFKNIENFNLKKTSTNFVKFFGNINSEILLIDGPPDTEEDKSGIPFISNKGELFEKMLNAIKLNKDDIFTVKSIPWRPPGNRYPTEEELKICRPFILNLIKLIKPRIIVCLGEVPTKQILNLDENILKVRGKWRLVKSEKFYEKDELKCEFCILPTLSISHLLSRPDLKKYAWEDLKLLRNKIKEIL